MAKSQALRMGLLVAIGSTMVTLTRVELLPSPAPRPEDLAPVLVEALKQEGWELQQILDGHLSRNVSTSESHELRRSNQIMVITPVRTRGPSSFKMQTLIAAQLGQSELAGESKLIENGGHQRLRFRQPALKRITEVSCINSGRTLADDKQLVEQELIQEAPQNTLEQLMGISGLTPVRRWDCLLVRLSGAEDMEWNNVWSSTLEGLRSWDQKRR